MVDDGRCIFRIVSTPKEKGCRRSLDRRACLCFVARRRVVMLVEAQHKATTQQNRTVAKPKIKKIEKSSQAGFGYGIPMLSP